MPEVEITPGRGAEKPGRSVRLRGTRILIGRARTCPIRLVADGTSPEHAALVFDGGAWSIRDLGSRDGTFLNGARISTATIAVGDVLGIGDGPDGAEVRIVDVEPPSDRHRLVPEYGPVASTPPVAPPTTAPRRGFAWPAILALIAVVSGLAWYASRPGIAIRPVVRATTPRELHAIVTLALRSGHPENAYDMLTDAARRMVARRLELPEGEDVRAAIHLRGGSRPAPEAWGELSDATLHPDGKSGTLGVRTGDGEILRYPIVLVDGGWRLDTPSERVLTGR